MYIMYKQKGTLNDRMRTSNADMQNNEMAISVDSLSDHFNETNAAHAKSLVWQATHDHTVKC